MKRLRLGRSSHSRHHHLRFLSETDCEESCVSTDKDYRSNGQGDRESAQHDESEDTVIKEDGYQDKAQTKAVVPYRCAQQQGQYPDKLELLDGIFGSLGWPQFPDVKDVQGNEMVLFRKPPVHEDYPTNEELEQEVHEDDDELHALEMHQSEFGYWEEASHPYSSLQIVDLSDDEDEGNLADDEGCYTRPSTASSIPDDDGPLAELQEKVMEMDLD
ncbi:hypothetical protein BG006_003881 [Podila minutissima]|uniref:Uncharacterized protein n=1 Tax=Podila minutissima TaxID=64525 RepID=A0A9P5VFS4_9FUNG|nr:hypothetical protein BG006_003881 [Podila minutissima]